MASGKFYETKKKLRDRIKAIVPEVTVTGSWRIDTGTIPNHLPFVSVRISPATLWDVYDRNTGGEVTGSFVDYHVSMFCFHSNCDSGDPDEKGKYSQDLADRIISGLKTQPSQVGFDVSEMQSRESEPAEGMRKISRVIIEGTIQVKRID